MPIYFSWFITALLSVSGDANNHNLPQSGRLFILRVIAIFRQQDHGLLKTTPCMF
jgi:hypothetical protein